MPDVDVVMAAIVGAAGIRPTFAAARNGKQVLLANKETMVMAGRIFMDVVKENNATLLPIDSEHNAIFQSLPHGFAGDLKAVGVRRILLTASGGPFRQTPLSLLEHVTPGASLRSSQLGDGAEDFGRLCDDDEQGSGSYRSPLAI